MKLKIRDNKSIDEVKHEFSSNFPGLKIEFVKQSHNVGEGSAVGDIIQGNPKLWEIRKFHTEMTVEINENQTVADIESLFKNKFGLHIQIFRRIGNTWIESVTSDSWTLREQMEKSKESNVLG